MAPARIGNHPSGQHLRAAPDASLAEPADPVKLPAAEVSAACHVAGAGIGLAYSARCEPVATKGQQPTARLLQVAEEEEDGQGGCGGRAEAAHKWTAASHAELR